MNYQSFIFTHIPKCGGTSFRNYIYDAGLKNCIDSTNIYIPGKNGIKYIKNIIGLSEEEIQALQSRQLKILACHAHYNVHKQYGLMMDAPFYYTILREPVSRVISHYNHFLFKGDNERFKNRTLQELSEDSLDNALKKQSNLQTIYLTGGRATTGQTVNDATLIEAKRILETEYACFGLLEHIGLSIQYLQTVAPAWLSFEGTFPHERKNEEPKNAREPLGEAVLQRIRDFNRYDMELYVYAQKLFMERCQRHDISL